MLFSEEATRPPITEVQRAAVAGVTRGVGVSLLSGNSFNQADLYCCTILYGMIRVTLRSAATEVGELLAKEIMRKVKSILSSH